MLPKGLLQIGQLWYSESIACFAVSLSFSSVLQITTKQCQFIKSLSVRLIFYIPDYFRCFPQCHSSLSRPFVKCYPQNCREILSLTITQQSTEITSYASQAKLLFICPSTAFASFSTIHNHVELVILLYPFPQSSSAELWSNWSFSALYLCSLCSCQGTIVCTCLYWITSHFFSVPLVCPEHYEF